VPRSLFSRAGELGDLLLPNSQVAQAFLVGLKCPIQVSFIVRKLPLVCPIEDSKFIILAQFGRPLCGAACLAVVLSSEQIPVLMSLSQLRMFVVLHCLALQISDASARQADEVPLYSPDRYLPSALTASRPEIGIT